MKTARRSLVAGTAAFGLALALFLVFALRGAEERSSPADAAALARVAEKNDDAALRAAARMRADSARAAAAAEASAETASAERP